MVQERKTRQKSKARQEETQVEETQIDVSNEELAQAVDATLEKIDDILEDQLDEELLADIDEVLGTEQEAAAMVAEFVQQGGE